VQEKMPLPLRPQEWKADALERLCSISAYYLLQAQKRKRNAYELFIFTGICGATDNARILRKKSSLTFVLDRTCA
jgi:hypothetical protein